MRAMQDVLQRIGEATTGTKDVVQNRLLNKVVYNKMPVFSNTLSGDNRTKTSRILSIDMGIKNLAYCVADVETATPIGGITNMDFRSWRRLDLSEAYREYSLGDDQKGLAREAALEGREDEDLYTPQSLSRMAYWFLRTMISDWNPDVVLIERQRWRSSGSPTIQQWTVRVNTLEAIMWAVMTTMKTERNQLLDWQMHAVDPKRVGHFWLDGIAPISPPSQTSKKKLSKAAISSGDIEDDAGEFEGEGPGSSKKLSRGKAEKKAKIQLLRTWLDSDNPSTTLSESTKGSESDKLYPNISFSFSHQGRLTSSSGHGADATRQALLYATDTPSERTKRTAYHKAYVKKVDDITDCFLQATAWVAWADNLRKLKPHVDDFQSQVEQMLGRKLNVPWHLADAVKELQDREKKVIEEAESEANVSEKASQGKKMKTKTLEVGQAGSVEDESEKVSRTKRKAKK